MKTAATLAISFALATLVACGSDEAHDQPGETEALPTDDGRTPVGACTATANPGTPSSAGTTVLPAACGVTAPQGCNPLDAAGCDTAKGETCDLARDGSFRCFPSPNAGKLGEACDAVAGPFCATGLTCFPDATGKAICARACCASTECADGQTCTPLSVTLGNVGACTSGAPPATFAGSSVVGHHAAKFVGRGFLLPWTTWNDALAREVTWHATTCPEVKGYPIFASTTHFDGNCQMTKDDTIPATQNSMGILSYLSYWQYGGRTDARLLGVAKSLADYLVKEAVTPNSGAYPGFPRSTGHAQAVPQPEDCGTESDMPYEIEPDKGGMVGHALMLLAKETNDTSYSDVALHIANVLVANMVHADGGRSPWPFRVDYRTGIARTEPFSQDISSNMSYVLRLFDDLISSGHSEFAPARAELWYWIKGIQIPDIACGGKLWQQFFEDQPWPDNRNAWAPLSLAGYLLERRALLDQDWQSDAEKLLDFVNSILVVEQNGFPVCVEQDFDKLPYGGIMSTYAATLALHAAVTGSETSKQRAYQAFNLLVYAIDKDGCPDDRVLTDGRGGWIEDTHLDKVHNFVAALALFPEWAK
ncbi:hypothetical protein AKJ09_01360 [Labilithrix luteola]|uniref:Uncharacterized protein n=1 Tax=Labilithrix luteola TaxID=1391654 RepID=A0A0K1PMR3_9BACT|nr:hypothetical protein [Labilithrix luteola]AKU94696.1 hypothetical protein AKJ09_01360 [Labilithrix luteola]